jgi:hypothetical protein
VFRRLIACESEEINYTNVIDDVMECGFLNQEIIDEYNKSQSTK